MTGGIGHNQGPTLERGQTMRAYQWRRAQKALMPRTIPLMIVKMRVKRAAELGMDYKAYAAIRQATGRDICGLLFSSNALRIIGGDAAMPRDRAKALEALRGADRLALVHRPLQPEQIAAANPMLDATGLAPDITTSRRAMHQRLRAFVTDRQLVGDQVVIVGDTSLEAEWHAAARAAGYLSAERYFGA